MREDHGPAVSATPCPCFALAILLLIIAPSGVAAGQASSGFARIRKDVRMRADHSVKAEVVFYLKAGEIVEILDHTPEPVTIEGSTDYWYKVRTFDSYEGWSYGTYLEELEAPPVSRFPSLDTTTLPALLKDKGYEPSLYFKALVIRINGNETDGWVFSSFDFNGTSREHESWWPASNVKIFPAVALLEMLSGKGFSPKATLTFNYEKKKKSISVRKLITQAITHSNNRSYDQTVEAVGSRALNGEFFTAAKGLRKTLLLRSYTHRVLIEGTDGEGTTRHSPEIRIGEGSRKVTLPEDYDDSNYIARGCGGIDDKNRPRSPGEFQGNCTTLRDLAEVMRRVMMHEELPSYERYELSPENLALIREALAGKRARGNNIVEGLKKGLNDKKATFFHKPGYAMKWMSDVVFVRLSGSDERYVVVLANYPGRKCLDEASRTVGELIRENAFK